MQLVFLLILTYYTLPAGCRLALRELEAALCWKQLVHQECTWITYVQRSALMSSVDWVTETLFPPVFMFAAEVSFRSLQKLFIFIISIQHFLDQSIQQYICFILKKEALVSTIARSARAVAWADCGWEPPRLQARFKIPYVRNSSLRPPNLADYRLNYLHWGHCSKLIFNLGNTASISYSEHVS